LRSGLRARPWQTKGPWLVHALDLARILDPNGFSSLAATRSISAACHASSTVFDIVARGPPDGGPDQPPADTTPLAARAQVSLVCRPPLQRLCPTATASRRRRGDKLQPAAASRLAVVSHARAHPASQGAAWARATAHGGCRARTVAATTARKTSCSRAAKRLAVVRQQAGSAGCALCTPCRWLSRRANRNSCIRARVRASGIW
jgi:hypothetical protein